MTIGAVGMFTESGKSGCGPWLGASPNSFMRTGQGKRPLPSVLSVVIKSLSAKHRQLFFFCSNDCCRLKGLLALNWKSTVTFNMLQRVGSSSSNSGPKPTEHFWAGLKTLKLTVELA